MKTVGLSKNRNSHRGRTVTCGAALDILICDWLLYVNLDLCWFLLICVHSNQLPLYSLNVCSCKWFQCLLFSCLYWTLLHLYLCPPGQVCLMLKIVSWSEICKCDKYASPCFCVQARVYYVLLLGGDCQPSPRRVVGLRTTAVPCWSCQCT